MLFPANCQQQAVVHLILGQSGTQVDEQLGDRVVNVVKIARKC